MKEGKDYSLVFVVMGWRQELPTLSQRWSEQRIGQVETIVSTELWS